MSENQKNKKIKTIRNPMWPKTPHLICGTSGIEQFTFAMAVKNFLNFFDQPWIKSFISQAVRVYR
jgi:hypothetical protein